MDTHTSNTSPLKCRSYIKEFLGFNPVLEMIDNGIVLSKVAKRFKIHRGTIYNRLSEIEAIE